MAHGASGRGAGVRLTRPIVLALAALAAAAWAAEPPPVSVPPPAAAVPTPNCSAEPPATPLRGNLALKVTLDPDTIWQPRGNEVRFKIEGTAFSGDALQIVTCFRWRRPGAVGGWVSGATVRVLETGQGSISFAATVPSLPSEGSTWWARVRDRAPGVYTGLHIVPIADFRIVAAGAPAWSPLDIVLPLGITSFDYSFCLAMGCMLLALLVLYVVGGRRGVPGGPLLRIIATRAGYASLSQLQIVLWTLVVGTSAVYVMALSGNLIDVSTGTLVLLGITGVATVSSKLQSHQEDKSTAAAGGAAPAPPDPVEQLATLGNPGPCEVRLSWLLPNGGGRAERFVVQYRLAANPYGPWTSASDTVRERRLAVVGLQPGAAYEFRVIACNCGGSSAPSTVLPVTTAAAAAGGPAPVTACSAVSLPGECQVALSWLEPGGPPIPYIVQYRPHDSDETWRTASSAVRGPPFTVSRLLPFTHYDFRVLRAGSDGAGAAIAAAVTGPKQPRWSDLVVSGDGRREIDVTRVQMLFFTVISASFVGLKVLASAQIPDIPSGFLLLMGISNGVYITAKYVPE